MTAINQGKLLEAIGRFQGPIPHSSLASPQIGGQCVVYRVLVPRKLDWAVRVPVRLGAHAAESVIRNENELLRRLETTGFPWSPRVRGEELDCGNPVGIPFAVFHWLPGKPLSWGPEEPPSTEMRHHVLEQLTRAFISLLTCTRVDDPQREGYTEHVTRVVDNRIVRVCRGQLPFRVRDCVQHRRLLFALLPQADFVQARFVGHNDLAAQNILVDDKLNLTGIIDWTFAAEEPWQLAASIPRLLRVESVAGRGMEIAKQDLAHVVQILREQAPFNCSDVASAIADLWSRPDIDYVQLMLDAVGRRDCFDQLTQGFPDLEATSAMSEVADFLRRRGRLAGLQEEDVLARW